MTRGLLNLVPISADFGPDRRNIEITIKFQQALRPEEEKKVKQQKPLHSEVKKSIRRPLEFDTKRTT